MSWHESTFTCPPRHTCALLLSWIYLPLPLIGIQIWFYSFAYECVCLCGGWTFITHQTQTQLKDMWLLAFVILALGSSGEYSLLFDTVFFGTWYLRRGNWSFMFSHFSVSLRSKWYPWRPLYSYVWAIVVFNFPLEYDLSYIAFWGPIGPMSVPFKDLCEVHASVHECERAAAHETELIVMLTLTPAACWTKFGTKTDLLTIMAVC